MSGSPTSPSLSFETERLLLRSYRPGDGPWYYRMALRNKPHLSEFESGNAVMTIDSEEAAELAIRDFVTDWERRRAFFLGAFLKGSEEFVAQIYIGVVNWELPEFELGYFADVDHQGCGYVTEAARGALDYIFGHLEAQRVRLECDETNLRSLRVAERCGFVREGHRRLTKKLADGSCSGDLLYGLLRSEFSPKI